MSLPITLWFYQPLKAISHWRGESNSFVGVLAFGEIEIFVPGFGFIYGVSVLFIVAKIRPTIVG